MSETSQARMTVDEFLVWAEGRPGRFELVGGCVHKMASERVGHTRAKLAAVLALLKAIDSVGLPCEVLQDGATIRIDPTTAFEPDALVRCGPPLSDDSIETPDPVIVVEVLSPSTSVRDRGRKVAGYFRVPSISHYLIVDNDRKVVLHHSRTSVGIATRVSGFGALRLDPPGLDVTIAALLR